MGLNITDLRTELRQHLYGRDDPNEMGNPEADRFLNRAYWEMLSKFPFRENEKVTTINTVDHQSIYSVDLITDFHAVRKIKALNPAGHSPLDRTLDRGSLDWYNSQEIYYLGTPPTHYIRDGSRLIIYPTPNGIYQLDIYYLGNLVDLADSQGPEIPREWHEIILFGALWRIHLKEKNYAASNEIKTHWTGLINSSVPVEAKEEKDSTRAAVTMVRNTWRRGRTY